MIIEISVGVIAVCILVMTIRLYTLSIRVEETMRRWDELLLRIETDIRPILYDARDVISDLKGIAETAKQGTRRVNDAIEILVRPIQTLGIFVKAISVGIGTFLKKRGGEGHGL